MSFIFAVFGPSTNKPVIFNTECTSSFLCDQLKEVAYNQTELYSREQDGLLRRELSSIEGLLATHRRKEPKRTEGDEDAPSDDDFKNDVEKWNAEVLRLEALKDYRSKQVCTDLNTHLKNAIMNELLKNS